MNNTTKKMPFWQFVLVISCALGVLLCAVLVYTGSDKPATVYAADNVGEDYSYTLPQMWYPSAQTRDRKSLGEFEKFFLPGPGGITEENYFVNPISFENTVVRYNTRTKSFTIQFDHVFGVNPASGALSGYYFTIQRIGQVINGDGDMYQTGGVALTTPYYIGDNTTTVVNMYNSTAMQINYAFLWGKCDLSKVTKYTYSIRNDNKYVDPDSRNIVEYKFESFKYFCFELYDTAGGVFHFSVPTVLIGDTTIIEPGVGIRPLFTPVEVNIGDWENAYHLGMTQGYNEGKKDGLDEGYVTGKEDGRQEGYSEGYVDGANNASDYTFFGLISAVVDAPIQAVTGLFDFEILGYDMKNFMFSLLTVCVIITVIRLVL